MLLLPCAAIIRTLTLDARWVATVLRVQPVDGSSGLR